MANYRNTRALPVAFIVIIIVIAVVALAYVGQLLFFPKDSKVVSQLETSQAALISTSANRSVVMKVRGPIVADEDFRSYQIKITPNERVLTVYKGYMDQLIDNITLTNNIPAYEQFVYALNRVGLMDNNEFTGDNNDTRGICATGDLYEFQIYKGEKSVKKLWTTTCSGLRGSFGLRVANVSDLFINQIPGAELKIGDIW